MPAVRQQINIAASPRAIWKCFTTAEGLAAWWVDEARVDDRPGGRLVLLSEDDDGNPVEERGMFLTLRPTSKLEIKWDSASPAPTKGSRVQIQIARDGDESRVSVVHGGGELFDDDDARAALDKGWRQALRALRDHLEAQSTTDS